MKKRPYHKVDTSKFTTQQMRAYRKRLAAVRAYTQKKRAHDKLVKAGKLDPKFGVDRFHGATTSHAKAASNKAHVMDQITKRPFSSGKLDRMIEEITRARVNQYLDKLFA